MILSDNTYKPKVSIIIPVYNVKQYLSEALDSVINQTYKNLEIIVVDDGSNDGSEIICEEYAKKDERIKLIHRENGGLSAARNTGLDNVTGEYVAFLDSDDAFIPEAIEKAINIILLNNVDCISFRYIACINKKSIKLKNQPKGKIVPNMKKGIYSRKEALIAIANMELNVAVWSKLTKKEVWNSLRFPEGQVHEDLYIIFQMINRIENIYVCDEIFVLYRLRTGSIVRTYSTKNIKDLFYSWNVYENFVKEHIHDIFDKNQIQKTRKIILNDLIMRYVQILSLSFLEKSTVLDLMLERISYYAKVVKIENCRIEIRFIYYMIFNHPKLLSIFFKPCYWIYQNIKNLVSNNKILLFVQTLN